MNYLCAKCQKPCEARVILGPDRTGEVESACCRANLLHDDNRGWRMMETAPKDGTEVFLLIRHFNWQYAGEHDREKWEQEVTAKWIDHQGGGWTYYGMCGFHVGWRPLRGTPLDRDDILELVAAELERQDGRDEDLKWGVDE